MRSNNMLFLMFILLLSLFCMLESSTSSSVNNTSVQNSVSMYSVK